MVVSTQCVRPSARKQKLHLRINNELICYNTAKTSMFRCSSNRFHRQIPATTTSKKLFQVSLHLQTLVIVVVVVGVVVVVVVVVATFPLHLLMHLACSTNPLL